MLEARARVLVQVVMASEARLCREHMERSGPSDEEKRGYPLIALVRNLVSCILNTIEGQVAMRQWECIPKGISLIIAYMLDK